MKKLIINALIILFLYSPSIVFAHSGRTDSDGGHWNYSNNTYHFHNGNGGVFIKYAEKYITYVLIGVVCLFVLLCAWPTYDNDKLCVYKNSKGEYYRKQV